MTDYTHAFLTYVLKTKKKRQWNVKKNIPQEGKVNAKRKVAVPY